MLKVAIFNTPIHQHWWQAAKWAIGTAAAALSFVAAIYQITGGPPWPTAPDVHPSQSGSSLDTPLEVNNRSGLFAMAATLWCRTDLIFFEDSERQIGLMRGIDLSEGGVLSIPAGEKGGLPCQPGRYLQVRENGSVFIGTPNGPAMETSPGVFKPPIKILKLCLVATGTYKWFGRNEAFRAQMLQWPIAPGQPRWIEGPIANDNDQSRWIPPGTILKGAWSPRGAVTESIDGKTVTLRPAALKCTGGL